MAKSSNEATPTAAATAVVGPLPPMGPALTVACAASVASVVASTPAGAGFKEPPAGFKCRLASWVGVDDAERIHPRVGTAAAAAAARRRPKETCGFGVRFRFCARRRCGQVALSVVGFKRMGAAAELPLVGVVVEPPQAHVPRAQQVAKQQLGSVGAVVVLGVPLHHPFPRRRDPGQPPRLPFAVLTPKRR